MSFASVIASLNPTSHWRLGELSGTSAADAEGAVTGTYTGSPTLNQPSSLASDANPSVSFSGTSQYVSLGNNYPFTGTASFSLLIHAYPTTIDGSFRRLLAKAFYTSDAERGGWQINVSTAGLRVARQAVTGGVGGSDELTFATGLTLNAWNYIAATYDGSNLRLYLNGALVAGPLASTRSLPATTQNAGIAGSPDSNPYFVGRLDEVAVWSGVALSAANILALYEAALGQDTIQTLAGSFSILNAPDPPSNLVATSISTSQIDVTWQDNSTDEANFIVQRKTGSGGTWADVSGSLAAGTVNWSNTSGLTQGTLYYYRVRAVNATGDSDYSNEASAATVLPAPTGLSATPASASQINLAWTDAATAETGYEVEQRTAATAYANVATLAANSSSHNRTGLNPSTLYFFQVRAVNADTQSAWVETSATTNAAAPDVAPSALISVEIAFVTNPGDSPTWTDVTAYVQSVSLRRGRATERDLVEAGTCTVLLDNADRRFDPTFTTGPYYPNVLPMRRLRVRALYATVTYSLFHGYIDGWPQTYPGPLDTEVAITATDAFKVLAIPKISGDFPEELSGARVNRVLDSIGWPLADRNISAGQSTIQAVTLDNETALTHLRDVERSENGLLFVDKLGRVTWHDRHVRHKPPYTVSNLTLGEATGSGERLYVDVAFAYDDTFILNDVHITRVGGTIESVATDPTSKARYFTRTLSRDDLLITSEAEAESAANWLLARYKEPTLRAQPIELSPQHDPATMYPQLFGRELGDRMALKKRPRGISDAAPINQPSHLEAITLDYTANGGHLGATWQFSPADAPSYWLLGDSVYGLLQTSTRLGYAWLACIALYRMLVTISPAFQTGGL